MKLQNPFSQQTRELFRDVWECGECTLNGQERGGLTLHHILSRVSSSPLNGIILCGVCHGKVGHAQEEHIKLLRKTLAYLIGQGYKLQDKDRSFVEDNYQLYKKVLEL